METDRHITLKRLAMAFLHSHGCAVIGSEVMCPIARYRVDVAGYADRPPFDPAAPQPSRRRAPPRTVMIECKQSRSDFLTDARDHAQLFRRRTFLESRLEQLEGVVRETEPQLRRSDGYLFHDLESWELQQSTNPRYQRLVRRLNRIDQQLYGQTKFCVMARYRLADRLYLLAPQGMIRRRELPTGWGLIEVSRAWLARRPAAALDLSELPVKVRVQAPALEPRIENRTRLLRNAAAAATRDALAHCLQSASIPAESQLALW